MNKNNIKPIDKIMEAEKYILVLSNGKYAKFKPFNDRTIDVYEVDSFLDATFLTENEADLALQPNNNIRYDFGDKWDEISFVAKKKNPVYSGRLGGLNTV